MKGMDSGSEGEKEKREDWDGKRKEKQRELREMKEQGKWKRKIGDEKLSTDIYMHSWLLEC